MLQFEHFVDYLSRVLNSFWIWSRLHNFWMIFLSGAFKFFNMIPIAHFVDYYWELWIISRYHTHCIFWRIFLSWVLNIFLLWSRLHNFWRSFLSGVVNIFEYDSDWGRLLNWQSHQLLTASSGAVQLLNHNKVILEYISLLQSGNLNFQTFKEWLGNQIRAWNILTLKL